MLLFVNSIQCGLHQAAYTNIDPQSIAQSLGTARFDILLPNQLLALFFCDQNQRTLCVGSLLAP